MKPHTWIWNGRDSSGQLVNPGNYRLQLFATHAGRTTTGSPDFVKVAPLPPQIGHVKALPSPFYPIEQDGYRDTTTVSFTTNTNSRDTIRITTHHGRLVRTATLGTLEGHRTHSWQWDGHSNRGSPLAAGTYEVRIVSTYYGLKAASQPHPVVIKRRATSTTGGGGSSSNCTPGYSPCLIYHSGADYDCYGGSGNGPYYTAPGVVYTVSGSDPYGLDSDNDGQGCE